MVGAWALRLGLHLLLRSRGRPEDPRYAAFRQRYGPERYWWVSYFQVFLLQGMLAILISAPLQVAAAARAPDPVGPAALLGLLVFLVGFAIEVVADAQLQAFRDDPANRGRVLDSGLWRFSRHPNYFGEALLWWGFWLVAVGQPWGWVTIFAPLLMTFLLVKSPESRCSTLTWPPRDRATPTTCVARLPSSRGRRRHRDLGRRAVIPERDVLTLRACHEARSPARQRDGGAHSFGRRRSRTRRQSRIWPVGRRR